MRIFITGASGFVGSSILKLLSSQPHKLLLLAKDKYDRRLLGCYKKNVITGDLKNIKRLKKQIKHFNPQVLIHLAWEGIPDFSFAMCKRNLDNSLALVNFIINETDCKKIIVSGSCLEYGKTHGECKESDSIDINSFFSWAKYSLYCYLRFMCKKLDKDLIWFRIFYAYGPGQRKDSLIPCLIRSFKNGKRPDINSPLNANDFIHISDIASAFCCAVNKRIKSGIYNLGSGESTRVIDICRTIEGIINKKIYISSAIKKVNRDYNRPLNFWANIDKTKRALSWKPVISIERGIKDYIK